MTLTVKFDFRWKQLCRFFVATFDNSRINEKWKNKIMIVQDGSVIQTPDLSCRSPMRWPLDHCGAPMSTRVCIFSDWWNTGSYFPSFATLHTLFPFYKYFLTYFFCSTRLDKFVFSSTVGIWIGDKTIIFCSISFMSVYLII